MTHTYIIIDDNRESLDKVLALASQFPSLVLVGTATNYEDGLNLILEHNPQLVFLEIDPEDKQSRLSLALINELYRYLTVIPKIIVTTGTTELAYEAIRHEVFDFLIKPLEIHALRRTLLKLVKAIETSVPLHVPMASQIIPAAIDGGEIGAAVVADEAQRLQPQGSDSESPLEAILDNVVTKEISDKPLIICVKSYGDYRFIEANDISYLKADNNSTDIHLSNGEMITAFKTLKHFEQLLVKPFVRIHNSYIVNIDYVSRIHTGNSVCYIKGTTTKLPFSKSYKENIDEVLNFISTGNYLEF